MKFAEFEHTRANFQESVVLNKTGGYTRMILWPHNNYYHILESTLRKLFVINYSYLVIRSDKDYNY